MSDPVHSPSRSGLESRFAALCDNRDTLPNVFAFLEEHSEAPAAQRGNVLLLDQFYRWKAGNPRTVEQYLEDCPDIASAPDIKLRLVVEEFGYREQRGDKPDVDAYCARFPDLREELLKEVRERPLDSEQPTLQRDQPPAAEDTSQTSETLARPSDPDASPAAHPKTVGRYRVEGVLGEGAFGTVFMARDDDLDRCVAVKVPRREQIQSPQDIEQYLAEARVLASMDHPHIVPVYDVGRTDEGHCFVVSKFVEGTDLAETLNARRFTPGEAAELIATVADGLHHAHQKGLVHRDVKPANILLDTGGRPYVADFGLALREQEIGEHPVYAGTPAYMSPEQARGEAHRVDGRSDIFSLGVVFYELLTGTRPFHGDSIETLLRQITTLDARPPRQRDDTIPKELERICLKAVAKRAADRYTTAGDMADDLRHFLAPDSAAVTTAARRPTAGPSATAEPAPQSYPEPPQPVAAFDSDRQSIKLVPKGLRSFDAQDADFFLQLLPGPRDRDGLPDSLRFWKGRIEQSDADATFAVGLMYGPSGCGKSSLVKAGLLPRLAEHVIAVYVESTPDDTQSRLLSALRKHCPAVAGAGGLPRTLAALRRGDGLQPGEKVLIVLDQFEQWLHANRQQQESELVAALRQCDGGRVQCLVMVRDDFWMATTRFMREMEIRLREGDNSAAVDLFDPLHARKVLAAYGQAFGRLPENLGELNKEQQSFLDQAAGGLAREGKVVCVRLALFAEMIKGKPWTPATLKQVGGTEGVGVTFLEETFSAKTAPPEHRLHQQAARAVLDALLPEQGSDIKGHMRSEAELRKAAGYAERSRDFDDLIAILDTDLRLITPTEPEESSAQARHAEADSYYQLTHDYLVPSLRNWLTKKQKESRRGRAALRLSEFAAAFSAKPHPRNLPSLWEFLNIRLLTRRGDWNAVQRKMMRRASARQSVRCGVALVVLAVAITAGLLIRQQVVRRQQINFAEGLVQRLLVAETAEAPKIVAQMDGYRQWADPLLRQQLDNSPAATRQRLHASLALLPVDDGQLEFLVSRLVQADAEDFPILRDALADRKRQITERLWQIWHEGQADDQRFRAACALAGYAADDPRWPSAAGPLAAQLVSRSPVFLAHWMQALRPARRHLVEPLAAIFRDAQQPGAMRSLATEILLDYAGDRPEVLADLVMDADLQQFAVLFPKLAEHPSRAIPLLEGEIDRTAEPVWNDPPLDASWRDAERSVVETFERAHGMLAERFAFCQTMPLNQFLAVAEALRPAGYRPTHVRPYVVERIGNPSDDERPSVQLAAIWTRDGGDWQVHHGLSAGQLEQHDATVRDSGFRPIDVAMYRGGNLTTPATDEDNASVQYAAVWAADAQDGPETKLFAGLSKNDQRLNDAREFEISTYASVHLSSDVSLSSCILSKPQQGEESGQSGTRPPAAFFEGLATNYAGDIYPGSLQTDVRVIDAPEAQATRDRATANFYLNNNEDALTDLTTNIALLEKYQSLENNIDFISALASLYFDRAIVHARLDSPDESKKDLERYQTLFPNATPQLAYLRAVVAAHLGDDAAAYKRLETEIEKHADDAEFLIWAARAYAVASAAVKGSDVARANAYADRAVTLLDNAIRSGYGDLSGLQQDPDFDAVRRHEGFQQVLIGGKLDRRYLARWQESIKFASTELHGLTPREHLEQCRKRIADGYRPASISVRQTVAGQPAVTASVWQRPIVPENKKEQLAKRQASAASALLKMEKADRVWPLLRHQPDPRARTYLIHRMAAAGVDPQAVIDRLNQEQEVSARRALLLSLGEFTEIRLSPPPSLRDKLLAWYRDDPDPGIHGACHWLLRMWGETEELARIDAELAGGKLEDDGEWFVNGEGQTMVVFRGPVEFLMGSPLTEESHHWLHQRHIGRSFAIAAKELTKEQFARFKHDNRDVDWTNTALYSKTADSPHVAITWYEAAWYCNWLSVQEGIPPDQWCYEPNLDGRYAEGMRAKPNYLQLAGYRLPTEAEWEYACRAEAVTSRCYGHSDSLLGEYAWYEANSQERTWPVGSLKPNDFGLFDMHGNVWEWCHEQVRAYTIDAEKLPVQDLVDADPVQDSRGRVLRGGSINCYARDVRSAHRHFSQPASYNNLVSFRVARTYP